MPSIDREVEVKTTQLISVHGPYLDGNLDDPFGGGLEDYGEMKLTSQRLVFEPWFLGLIEEVRASRKRAGKKDRIDEEVKIKTTQAMSLYGAYLNNDVDDECCGGLDIYSDVSMKRHRLVSEAWFQEIVDEIRESRKAS